eukprot:GHVU01152471.1.p1 GENE.GHVU01152471.1~~GHVU01152471.1.p1  ORF type:complete len:578 (+),score=23.79 GHVU01152471.1:90-1823(+)
MGVTTTQTNKPLNPRGNDQSPLAYNRAKLFSGKALSFDGVNDSIDISNFSLNGYTAFSICFYKTDDFNNAMIFSSADSLSDGVNIYQVSPGYFRARLNGFNTDTDLEVSTKNGFFVLTYDGSSLNWYYQAQNIGSSTTSRTFAIANTTSTIGRQSFASTQYLNGQIAGFKIFNTALTAAQVADLYNNPEKVVPTGVDNTALKLWLPMQEGAGTTAYDGAPDALGSEEVTNGDFATDSDWTKEAGWTISGGKATFDGSATTNALYQSIGGVSGIRYIISFEVTDYVSGSFKAHLSNGNVSAATPSINANGKYVFDITATGALILFRNENIFNGSIDNVSVKELTSYGTISGATWTHGIGAPVAQTSVIDWNKWTLDGSNDILIPQGLTSGRDLLGNLFENVRKQGALNLDGNSWAEVHDNESVDFGTGSFTFEAWAKYSYVSQGSSLNAIISLGGDIGQGAGHGRAGLVSSSSGSSMSFFYDSTGNTSTSSFSEGDWVHFVGVYDETNAIVYINGAEERTTARTAASMTNADVKQIGRDSTEIRYYTDQIAQPRIYNRALTAEEVQRNYNAGKNTYTN